ncbi:MAG: hypothetical protein V4857_31590 [Pseudomonadota bacterium]
MRDIPLFLARLKLGTDADAGTIRRAYARELKLVDQQHDAGDFQYLREAYEMALRWAGYQSAQAAPGGLGQRDGTDEAGDELQQAPAPAPHYGVPGVKVKLKSELKSEPKSTPEAAAEPGDGAGLGAPHAVANAVFERFHAACIGLGANHPIGNIAAWEAQLRADLDDGDLLNIEARTIFEGRIAQLLAGGWRPGHNMLLNVATAAFNWQQDRRRLNQFGHHGARINRAIDQRNGMDAREMGVIARLNTPGMPGGAQLKRDMAVLEPMMARFPDWMALMVDPQTVATWRELYGNMPGVASASPFGIDESRMPKSNAKNARPGSAGWGAGALLLMLVLGSILNNATREPTPAPVAYAPVFETGKPFGLPFPPAPSGVADPVPAWMASVQQPAQREAEQEAEGELVSQQRIDDIYARIRYAPARSSPPGERLVEYDVDLDAQGRVKALVKTRASIDIAYDEAVAKAITGSKRFPRKTMRQFRVYFTMLPAR